ncbi:MAG: alpha-glucosidase C-terminal domain-containing protein, partial [Clostridia bacterium]|nr:alpha-glucosidase C-terminal domain-containing protein [Clostridia bacterium]
PMQWNSAPNAGFTTGTPWIAVNPNYTAINVAEAQKDPDSVLNYYKKLLKLRKQYDIIVYGDYKLILEDHEEIYAYTRTLGEEVLLVVLNFFGKTPVFELPIEMQYSKKELLIANYDVNSEEDMDVIKLRPYEARVYKLAK